MAGTKTRTPAERPLGWARSPRKSQGHLAQLALLLTAAGVLIGVVLAWRVVSQDDRWQAWSMNLRRGQFGLREGREAQGVGNSEPSQALGGSIRYHGGGYAEMGEFSVGRFDAVTGTTLKVHFLLKGMTSCGDEASFDRFMRENHRAFREQVSTTIRDCRPADFTDSRSLGRKVKVRVNRAFGRTFLESAQLEEFEVFESVGDYAAEPWRPMGDDVARRLTDP